MNHRILLASGLAAILALGSSAGAASTASKRVSFCGPVTNMVEGSCIGVTDAATSTLYDISGATPKPSVGATIRGSGIPDGAMTTCQQGTHLAAIRWHHAAVCPLAHH